MNPQPFAIGDRVVCVNAAFRYTHLSEPQPAAPAEGQTYTVRDLSLRLAEGWPVWGVLLEGITCKASDHDGMEWNWAAHRFRRVEQTL